ncbi:MAG: nuclear transport factor 2 family protein [Acidobacteriota bacterium]
MPPSRFLRRLVLCFAVWTLLPVVGQAEPSEPPADATIDSLAAADQRFNRAAAERDRDTFRDLLSSDVVFLAGEPQRGRVAVLAIWQHLFDGKFDFRYQAETIETAVAESGELGWAIGTVRTSFRRPGVETQDVVDGHYLNVWTHTDDGWRLAHMASLVVHPTLGAAREPRSGLMTAWPELADQIGATIELDWTPTSTMRAESGELAVTVGDYTASFTDPADAEAEPIAGSGAFLSVWRKDADDRWQLAGEGFTPPGIYGSRAETP